MCKARNIPSLVTWSRYYFHSQSVCQFVYASIWYENLSIIIYFFISYIFVYSFDISTLKIIPMHIPVCRFDAWSLPICYANFSSSSVVRVKFPWKSFPWIFRNFCFCWKPMETPRVFQKHECKQAGPAWFCSTKSNLAGNPCFLTVSRGLLIKVVETVLALNS